MIEIDKNKGVWNGENTSQLDDLAYCLYYDVSLMLLCGEIDGRIEITQKMFMAGKQYLYCFYIMANKKLRTEKLKNIIFKYNK